MKVTHFLNVAHLRLKEPIPTMNETGCTQNIGKRKPKPLRVNVIIKMTRRTAYALINMKLANSKLRKTGKTTRDTVSVKYIGGMVHSNRAGYMKMELKSNPVCHKSGGSLIYNLRHNN